MSAEDLLEAALALPLNDRAKLAREIIASLDGPADPGAEAAWTAEIRRRMQDLDEGRVEPMSLEEVKIRIAARLKSVRSR